MWESKDGRHYTDSIPYESKTAVLRTAIYGHVQEVYQRSAEKQGGRKKTQELTLEVVKENGLENYDEEEIFGLCSRTIRENNYENDDFLTYVCFELFKKQQYDKVILTYLANYYCGATSDMKLLWREARDYEVHTHKLAERILTQMLFSEELFQEAQIFRTVLCGRGLFPSAAGVSDLCVQRVCGGGAEDRAERDRHHLPGVRERRGYDRCLQDSRAEVLFHKRV